MSRGSKYAELLILTGSGCSPAAQADGGSYYVATSPMSSGAVQGLAFPVMDRYLPTAALFAVCNCDPPGGRRIFLDSLMLNTIYGIGASPGSTLQFAVTVAKTRRVVDYASTAMPVSPSGDVAVSAAADIYYSGIGTNGTSLAYNSFVSMGAPLSQSASRVAGYIVGQPLRMYEVNGTDWSRLGNEFFLPNPITTTTNLPNLVALSGSRIAFFNTQYDTITTFDFDGTDWTQVGPGNSFATLSDNAKVTPVSGSDVVYIDSTNKVLRMFHFDGTNWTQTGNASAAFTVTGPVAVAAMTGSTVAVKWINGGTNSLQVWSFDGTNWSGVGAATTVGIPASGGLTSLTSTDVADIDNGAGFLTTFRFTAGPNTWAAVGSQLAIGGTIGVPFTMVWTSRIGFVDGSTLNFRMYDWGGAAWSLTAYNYYSFGMTTTLDTAAKVLARGTAGIGNFIVDGDRIVIQFGRDSLGRAVSRGATAARATAATASLASTPPIIVPPQHWALLHCWWPGSTATLMSQMAQPRFEFQLGWWER